MSDKFYIFDESLEEISQFMFRSDVIYGDVGEEDQYNVVIGFGKFNNDYERDVVIKLQYKIKVKM